MQKNPGTAFLVLRIGLALVFFWFAVSQLRDPAMWTGFLPRFVDSLPVSPENFVRMNAVFEIVCASLLVIGVWVRGAALLLALHLFGIAFTIGMSATGVRDFGLAVASLALFFGGAGSLSFGGSK